MRLPRQCPELDLSVLENVVGQMGIATPTPEGKYLHWDQLRHRDPPNGLTHEQWWQMVNFTRFSNRKNLSVLSKTHANFHYCPVDQVQEMTSEIDRRASGQIAFAGPVANPATRDRYIMSSLIEESITSSQLEGAATTRRVAKAMLRSGRKPKNKDERMIANNFLAMEKIQEIKGSKLTLKKLLDLHRTLTEDTLDDPAEAGRFRRADEKVQVVGDIDQVLHVPPPASELPTRVGNMLRFANGEDSSEYIPGPIRAIILHFWLAYDHPFVDGNGRTARALFYWSMLSQRYWLAEFVSISSILKKAPARYRTSYLYSESSNGDITYFVLYQLRVFLRSIDALDTYLHKKIKEQKSATRLLRSLDMLNHRQAALITHALRNDEFEVTIEWHKRTHQVSYQTARTDLLELKQMGLFKKIQIGNAYHFYPEENLNRKLDDLRN